MNLDYNKQDAIPKPISSTTVASSEYNQIAGSLMHMQNTAGLTADANDLTQITTAINKLGAAAGMPSNIVSALTLGASGSEYTAPANGYFVLGKTLANAQYIAMTIPNVISVAETSSGSQTPTIFLPVLKGQTMTATYTGTGAVTVFQFVYAEGSKQEAQ